MKIFQMRECTPDKFLGIKIRRNRAERKLYLLQDVYISNIAARFHLQHDSNKYLTPLPLTYPDARTSKPNNGQGQDQKQGQNQDQKQGQTQDQKENYAKLSPHQIYEYQQKVGSIGYAAVFSRPDVAKAHSILAEHLQNPSIEDIRSADRVIQYLYQTQSLGILYDGRGATEIFQGASDAAFADDISNRASSEGFLFKLFGGPIDWAAKEQRTVTKSTTEAELTALSHEGSHYKWWLRFLESIQFEAEQEMVMYGDNQATIRIATNEIPKINTKLRHTDVHQNWLRQETQRGHITIKWLPTAEMPADGFTRLLTKQQQKQFLKQLNWSQQTRSSFSYEIAKPEGGCQNRDLYTRQ